MKIAIVGAGISGLTSAYLLNRKHDITVFEANDHIGGHTHTIDVREPNGVTPVDTGFIIFNEKNYPNFVKLITQINVPSQPTNMSFSVQCEKTGLVFCPSSFNALFVQRKNLFKPSFYRMLLDANRFRKAAASFMKSKEDEMTLLEYLKKENYSEGFINQLIIPMGAAIWSADPDQFMNFPAKYFAAFFQNHGFLNLTDQPQWRTIQGGSKQYLPSLTDSFKHKIKVSAPVKRITRQKESIQLTLKDNSTHTFDQVVIAVHSDQALKMLGDASSEERDILSAIPYQENETVLHTDASIMPPDRPAWASWNYRIPKDNLNRVAMTYYMNMLQNLSTPIQYFVTLNMTQAIDPKKIIKTLTYHHPVYDPKGLKARNLRHQINGVNRTYFCGAYWGYGFHEDGVRSAVDVASFFEISL